MQTTSCVGYIRVSLAEQAAEGISLDAQRAAIDAYAKMRGLDLVEIVAEPGVSGGKALSTRDGGRRILELVRQRRVRSVVAYKLDRLFRDCQDCLATTAGWDRGGVALHLLDMGGQAIDTSSAMGRFFLTVLAGAAEMERNLIRERTSTAMRHKKSRGEYTGGHAPFGWRLVNGELEAIDSEQAAIAEARRLRANGLSLREVSRSLQAAGHRTRNGRAFAAQQVANMTREK